MKETEIPGVGWMSRRSTLREFAEALAGAALIVVLGYALILFAAASVVPSGK